MKGQYFMNNNKTIDLSGKNDEEVLSAYKEIAKQTLVAKEIYKKANSLNQALNLYELHEQKIKKGDEKNESNK